jgi:hypothetical protein
MSRAHSTIFVCFTLAALAACTSGKPPSTVEEGPASATGTVIPVEISFVRRGTHALVIGGKTTYYLESKSESLQAYEGQTVFVKGTLKKNTDPEDLPVLIVDTVKMSHGNESLHSWEVPTLNLRIKAPETWGATIEDGVVTFSLVGEESPLLTIKKLPSNRSLPRGSFLYAAGRRGSRTTPEKDTMQDVYIQETETVIHFHFDVSTQKSIKTVEEGQILLSEFENLFSSLTFLSDQSSSSLASGTGASIGIPCGGIAGILCPSGYFCDITDTVENIGRCRAL